MGKTKFSSSGSKLPSNVAQTATRCHPQERSNPLSNIFFCWTTPVFKKGLKKELTEEDLFQTHKNHDSTTLSHKIQLAFNDQKDPSLWLAIWRVFKGDIFISILIYFITELILKLSRPLALGRLMQYYVPGQSEISQDEAIVYASIIIGASFVSTILGNAYVIHNNQLGMKVRICCSALIYRKALKLSTTADTSIGHVTNLLSNDVTKLRKTWDSFNAIWSTPIQTVLILYLLYIYTGITSLVGVVFLLTLIPFQMYMSKKSAYYRLRIALKSDERIRTMSEIISGIQIIKMYNWEQPFIALIDFIRRKEMQLIKIGNYLDAARVSLGFFVDRTAIFLCVLTYVLTKNVPNAQYVFIVSAFYQMLMNIMSLMLPEAVSRVLQANVSVKRFEHFLNLPEVYKEPRYLMSNRQAGVKLEGVTCKWIDSSQHTLSNINFEAKPHELVAVIGPLGSGKSSLLNLCLEEIPFVVSGKVDINGSVSYASQEPWIFAGTIKENIVFGQEKVNEKRYYETLKVCSLEADLTTLPYGDKTIIGGPKGIALSGGQKARINLARAVYKDADVYLLDDPLSALDASVGRQIFKNCITHYLRDKCTILVTHQLQHLTSADRIYLLENGQVCTSGSYEDLQNCGESFAQLLSSVETSYDHSNGHVKEREGQRRASICSITSIKRSEQRRSSKVGNLEDDEADNDFEFDSEISEVKEDDSEATKKVKVEDMKKNTGKVSAKMYAKYFKYGGSYCGLAIVLLLFMLTELSATGANYFITFWVNLEQKKLGDANYNVTIQNFALRFFDTDENCIYFYSSVITSLMLFATLRSVCFLKICKRASVNLHNSMFTSIISATMRFFQVNPPGRILNRFSSDVGNVDDTVPYIFMDTLQLGLALLATTLSIGIVNPLTLIPAFIIFGLMFGLRAIFLASSRDIKRIEARARSPLLSHVSESLKGLPTIRAFGVESILERDFYSYQNVHSSAFYLYLATRRAFATWLDLICAFYLCFSTIIALMGESFGGNVGFIITQALNLTNMFQFGIKQWSELENQMTSVERMIEYSKLEPENHSFNENSDKSEKQPPSNWPENGKIVFDSVYVRYSAKDPHVLKNLKLTIEPRQKIGIVGRTGAGKSSLISVLFRLVNCEQGHIYIDGVDTKDISLDELRSKISIIPQEPVLFSGTIRRNLDPFERYKDYQIWNALEAIDMKEFVKNLPNGLESCVSDGGSNYSMGQKQLICLARALLRENKILVLDEATASVDPQTDELLQKIIREHFKDCTVLTIAHRLATVMDSDKVLVVDDGLAAEFDHPYLLLNAGGKFYSLVMESGRMMRENLKQIAKRKYEAAGLHKSQPDLM